jgi:hypothetical protein
MHLLLLIATVFGLIDRIEIVFQIPGRFFCYKVLPLKIINGGQDYANRYKRKN